MVEVVHRPVEDHEVPLGIDVAGGAPGDLREIVDVHVRADDDDRLRQHHEAHAPERRHHLARVARVALLDRHDHEVLEDTLGRHVDVDDLGQQEPDDGHEQALGRLAEPVVLLRRPTDDRRRVDRPGAARDRRQVEDGILAGQRVVAGVVTEGAFEPALAGIHVALEHDLGLRGHLEVDGPARDHLHAAPAEPAREDDLVHGRWQRRRRRVDQRGIAAEGDRDGHAVCWSGVPGAGALRGWRAVGTAWLRCVRHHALVLGATLVGLPVHAEGPVVEHLEAVHADVARARLRVPGEHTRQRDVAAAVLGPAAQHRQARERCALGLDHLLARGVGHAPGPRLHEVEERAELPEPLGERAGQLHVEELGDALAELVQGPDAERQRQPVGRAEGVDEYRHVGALDALEEERQVPVGRALRDAIGDLGDLEVARDRDGHAAETPGLLEAGDELPEIAERAHSRIALTRGRRRRRASPPRRGRRGSGRRGR